MITVQRPHGWSDKRRGNPAWGQPYNAIENKAFIHPTRWELMLRSLGITEFDIEVIKRSIKVKTFVHNYKNNYYIPEWVLDYYGVQVHINFGD